MKDRYLATYIKNLCFRNQKMSFVSGPRQSGKTTLAKIILKERKYGNYYNYDETEFRKAWIKDPKSIVSPIEGKNPIIILDEIHKAKLWKRSLKGIYDTLDPKPDIIVTGSARLNVYRKGSDSLMGRYYHFRLHPFSLGELEKTTVSSSNQLLKHIFNKQLSSTKKRQKTLELLFKFSGFPEPFLTQQENILRLWRKGRTEKIIREDLRDLTRIPELSQIEMLVSLFPERIGSFLSRAALRQDLEVSFDTVKRWLSYLKELYYIFEIKPFGRKIKQTLKKEGKSYLWDYSEIASKSLRFENLVACHLLKSCDLWTDSGEGDFELFCLRDKQKHEIDFLICKDGKPWLPIEVKLNETNPSPNWTPFLRQLPCKKGIQILLKPNIWQTHKNKNIEVLVASAADILPLFA